MTVLNPKPKTGLVLRAKTAGDIMSVNPISVRHEASIREAVVLMTDRGIPAAPVIDDKGRPIGVISISDVLVHNREYVAFLRANDSRANEFLPDLTDLTTAAEIMTPTVFTVQPDTPAAQVVRNLIELKVHHLFVSDREGTLVGVISAGDVLRHLN